MNQNLVENLTAFNRILRERLDGFSREAQQAFLEGAFFFCNEYFGATVAKFPDAQERLMKAIADIALEGLRNDSHDISERQYSELEVLVGFTKKQERAASKANGMARCAPEMLLALAAGIHEKVADALVVLSMEERRAYLWGLLVAAHGYFHFTKPEALSPLEQERFMAVAQSRVFNVAVQKRFMNAASMQGCMRTSAPLKAMKYRRAVGVQQRAGIPLTADDEADLRNVLSAAGL